jgi:hypothetical protein
MLGHRPRYFVGVCLLVAVGACSLPAEQPSARLSADAQVRALAAAKPTMAPRFDIKHFHDRVLEDGAVPVSFLREKIRAWGQTK